jgi:chromosome segregation ATPase
MEGLKRNIVD